MSTYSAIYASEPGPATFGQLSDQDLPEGDVTVDVAWSSLNYKDGLAVTGKGRIMRSFPMVAGIDLAGVVASSDSAQWKRGDEVVLTGWGLSEVHPGGFTQRQRVRSEWLTPKPPELTLQQTMAVGTAGLTAMLCVLALEGAGLQAGDGEVVVTGAAGGVGSIAVAVLAKLGHAVTASTGRAEAAGYLRKLGATGVIDRNELATPGRPLDKERWAGAHRHRGKPDSCHAARPDPVPGGGRRVWPGGRKRPSGHGPPLHPASGVTARDRLGDVSAGAPGSGVAAAG